MDSASAHVPSPCFIDGSAGRLFALHHPAAITVLPRRALIYVAPFAEEMNRARRTAALQARALAEKGIDALLLDLFGTGDSEGDFRDARWQIWLEDIAAGARWLRERRIEIIGLWGLRLGALLAVAAASSAAGQFQRLLLWQPVVDGKNMLTQVLRIRVAAGMHGQAPRETTDTLRRALAAAGSIEVAGYEISADLAQALDAARMDRMPLPPGLRVDLFELGGEQGLTMPVQRTLQLWRDAGLRTSATVVSGEQFWAVQEAAPAMGLIEATTAVIEAWSD